MVPLALEPAEQGGWVEHGCEEKGGCAGQEDNGCDGGGVKHVRSERGLRLRFGCFCVYVCVRVYLDSGTIAVVRFVVLADAQEIADADVTGMVQEQGRPLFA